MIFGEYSSNAYDLKLDNTLRSRREAHVWTKIIIFRYSKHRFQPTDYRRSLGEAKNTFEDPPLPICFPIVSTSEGRWSSEQCVFPTIISLLIGRGWEMESHFRVDVYQNHLRNVAAKRAIFLNAGLMTLGTRGWSIWKYFGPWFASEISSYHRESKRVSRLKFLFTGENFTSQILIYRKDWKSFVSQMSCRKEFHVSNLYLRMVLCESPSGQSGWYIN